MWKALASLVLFSCLTGLATGACICIGSDCTTVPPTTTQRTPPTAPCIGLDCPTTTAAAPTTLEITTTTLEPTTEECTTAPPDTTPTTTQRTPPTAPCIGTACSTTTVAPDTTTTQRTPPTAPCIGTACSTTTATPDQTTTGTTTQRTPPTAPCLGTDCSTTTTMTPDTTTTAGSTMTESTTLPETTTTVETTTTGVTTSKPPTEWKRTVVFMAKYTQVGQDVFIRGGIDEKRRPTCTPDTDTAALSPCAIDIITNSVAMPNDTANTHWDLYNAWRVNDDKLDWYGAQPGQGLYQGQQAQGTPLAWTTNVVGAPEYHPLNKWGRDTWIVDMDMDCSKTENGWFELKGFLKTSATGGDFEPDINQSGTACTGTAGGLLPPYASVNHFARCGFINFFSWSVSACEMNAFP